MNISFHTGKTAMIAHAKALEVYANNMANINTVGYQTLRPDFADCIYTDQRETEPDWQTGHGAYVQKTDLMFSESHFIETGIMSDFTVAGEGFFAVQDRYGDINYTRDGRFEMTQLEDGQWYLVSGNGEYVLDNEGQRIVVPFEENNVEVDWSALCQMVGVYEFPNPYGLEAFGGNRYQANGRSGEPVANPEANKMQGWLTASNVDLATQMVKLIETQRAYQLSSRVVTTSDEFARIANNLR